VFGLGFALNAHSKQHALLAHSALPAHSALHAHSTLQELFAWLGFVFRVVVRMN